MHKISKESIRDLANQLVTMIATEDSMLLLEKARELYEKITLLHYDTVADAEIAKKNTYFEDTDALSDYTEDIDIVEKEDTELSVQEQIQKIMDTAAQIGTTSEPKTPTTDKIEKKPEPPTPSDLKNKNIPHASIEEEFEDAISADFAADLFENLEKIEMTKKSLNDKLSQRQIQIGLNDRIAFVKHLFNGSQEEFNRVLSQLNSFQTESKAKHFIESVVKPDYGWEEKPDYEERLIALIERKFK